MVLKTSFLCISLVIQYKSKMYSTWCSFYSVRKLTTGWLSRWSPGGGRFSTITSTEPRLVPTHKHGQIKLSVKNTTEYNVTSVFNDIFMVKFNTIQVITRMLKHIGTSCNSHTAWTLAYYTDHKIWIFPTFWNPTSKIHNISI